MESSNTLEITVAHTADWWLGNLDDPWFNAMENAIREEWGVEPLRIREGGVCVFLVDSQHEAIRADHNLYNVILDT